MLIHKNNRAMNKHLLDVQVYLSLDNYRHDRLMKQVDHLLVPVVLD